MKANSRIRTTIKGLVYLSTPLITPKATIAKENTTVARTQANITTGDAKRLPKV